MGRRSQLHNDQSPLWTPGCLLFLYRVFVSLCTLSSEITPAWSCSNFLLLIFWDTCFLNCLLVWVSLVTICCNTGLCKACWWWMDLVKETKSWGLWDSGAGREGASEESPGRVPWGQGGHDWGSSGSVPAGGQQESLGPAGLHPGQLP